MRKRELVASLNCILTFMCVCVFVCVLLSLPHTRCHSVLPLSILVFSDLHHIMSHASIVNNCIVFNIAISGILRSKIRWLNCTIFQICNELFQIP